MKLCPKCKRVLSSENFYTSKITSDGLRYECKDCSKANNIKYRKKDYYKKYYKEHKEQAKASHNRYISKLSSLNNIYYVLRNSKTNNLVIYSDFQLSTLSNKEKKNFEIMTSGNQYAIAGYVKGFGDCIRVNSNKTLFVKIKELFK